MPKPSIPNKRDEAINNLINSIASEENALANIITAEGRKLEKVTNMNSVDADTLLCVNKSVQLTINAITRLEVLLATKLDSISCEVCPTPCQCDKCNRMED